jgi:hypothetical protein
MWRSRFEWDGLGGNLEVECVPNDDPAGYGTVASDAYGFPVCTARVEYPRRGYRSMFGWVQLVRSTDNTSRGTEFEVDPFALFGDARSPYCWYGTEPTLFDAPSRLERAPLEWLSYSFLATTPLAEVLSGNPRRVVPIAGFSWGFDVGADGSIALRAVETLTTAEWESVVTVLRTEYPSPLWTFADAM